MKALSQAAPMSLHELDEFLTSDGAPDRSMALSNLDGFLTAVAIGPDRIKPSEWLPRIWGDESPEFLSEEEADRVIGTILGRYNQIITGALHGSLRHPVGGRDPQEGDDEDADNSFGRRGFGP